jgi:hypothetical protein
MSHTVFVLWKQVDGVHTIEKMCDDVADFKRVYQATVAFTKNSKKFFWTRENFVIG